MAKIELTFPVFYQCAIKTASPIQQYNCVNILLRGKPMANDGKSIQETTVSTYVNGGKPLPKDLIYELLHLSAEEIIRRFKELSFFDVSAIAARLIRLLKHASITDTAKESLLAVATAPDMEYRFLCEVFWASLKNSSNTRRLSKEEKAIIKACRDNTAIPDDKPETQQKNNTDDLKAQAYTVYDFTADIEASSKAQHREYDPEGLFTELLSVRIWQAQTKVDVENITDFCYSIMDDESAAIINLDYADIASVVNAGNPERCCMLECRGNQSEIVQYLSNTHRLSGAIAVIIEVDGSCELSLETVNTVSETVVEKIHPEATAIFGAKILLDVPVDWLCVRILYSFD